MEHERKFAVATLPSGMRHSSEWLPVTIVQGYLQTGALEWRVRYASSGHAWLTVKDGHGLSRGERERIIPPALACRMLSMTPVGLIKVRHEHASGWTLDCYHTAAGKMWVAECELDEPRADLPALPAGLVLGDEVTGHPSWRAQALAQPWTPLPD
jgi:CYTH domain-containing protein